MSQDCGRSLDFPPPPSSARPEVGLDAVLGIGTNVGDRVAHLYRATVALGRRCRLTAVSALYCTAPWGGTDQADFLNAAVRLSFPGEPRELLRWLLQLERQAGRCRSPASRWGPRPLDLDVLWISGTLLRDSNLSVPHPHLEDRAFAIRPLLDVAPYATHPGSGRPYSSVAAALGSPGIHARIEDWIGVRAYRPRPTVTR